MEVQEDNLALYGARGNDHLDYPLAEHVSHVEHIQLILLDVNWIKIFEQNKVTEAETGCVISKRRDERLFLFFFADRENLLNWRIELESVSWKTPVSR